ALQLASGLPDPRGERIERTLGVDALDAQRLQALGQRSLLGADGLALGDQLGALRAAPVLRFERRLQALARALEVLLVVGDRERRGVMAVAQVVELVGGLHELALGSGVGGGERRELGVERGDLALEITHLARPREDSAASLLGAAAADQHA